MIEYKLNYLSKLSINFNYEKLKNKEKNSKKIGLTFKHGDEILVK